MEKRGIYHKSNRAQVWVETVIYTLIGLTIMGILLGIAVPKIKQINDQTVISNTLDYTLVPLHQNIIQTMTNIGEERNFNLRLKKGELLIDGASDSLVYTLKGTSYKASQPGVLIVNQGDVQRLTTEVDGKYNIALILNYSSMNITFNGKDDKKILTAASLDYSIQIQNKGNSQINFQLL